MQYWFTTHWAGVDENTHGVFIRQRKRPRNEALALAEKRQREMHRGDLVFIYETENNEENKHAGGRKKVVALVKVTDKPILRIGRGGWIQVGKTAWVTEIDCPAKYVNEITGIRSIGKTYPNFGGGTNIQKIEKPQALRLLRYVCDRTEYYRLVREYFSDELEDEEYQQSAGLAEPVDYQETPRKTQYVNVKGSRQVKRNPAIAKRRLLMADYKCEIDSGHQTFTSCSTNKNYVEVHHLVPLQIEIQEEFGNNSLDNEANIFSLCPNCHRLLHHAVIDEKEDLLRRLFETRKKQLKTAGIDLTIEKLISYYRREQELVVCSQ
jgi:5-methylcytosine-specific restriction endonuclease McrA